MSRLRSKLILILVPLNLILALFIGYLVYESSSRLFYESFLANKLALVHAIASSIDGDRHRTFTAAEDMRDPEYQRYFRHLNAVLSRDRFISYLYTLNYDAAEDKVVYILDGQKMAQDTVWVESGRFAFQLWLDEDGWPVVKHKEKELHRIQSLELVLGGRPRLDIKRSGAGVSLLLDEWPFFSIVRRDPLTLEAAAGILDKDHRVLETRMADGERLILSFSGKNMPASIPGAPFIGDDAELARVKSVFQAGADYIDREPVSGIYGVSITAYGVIRDSMGRPAGMVALDVFEDQLEKLRALFGRTGLFTAGVAFLFSLLLSYSLGWYLTGPVRRLSSAVAAVSAGRFSTRIEQKRNDEFGLLFNAFNSMVDFFERSLDERRRMSSRLAYLAYFDSLTGLANRKSFYEKVRDSLNQAERGAASERLKALLYLNLDSFKDINESLGHEAGDSILKEVAQRLLAKIRQSDWIFRLEGDEFAVLLNRLSLETDAAFVAEKLMGSVSEPIAAGAGRVHVGMSIGIALYPRDGVGVEELLRRADTALAEAKRRRSGFRFFTSEMQDRASEKINLISHLHRGIAGGEFVPYYQPQCDLGSRLTGSELLVRWRHPEWGLVPPMRFIPLAEETNLIVAIGASMIQAACADLRSLDAEGIKPVSVAVNLSMRQLVSENLIGLIEESAATYGIVPGRLHFEITESCLMDNDQGVLERVERLNSRGFRFSIDDFGTGYSSLSRLSRLPIETIKIDKTFVHGLPASRSNDKIVKAIISLAHDFGMTVIAEGVETVEQRDYLASIACDKIQGYLISPPLPLEKYKIFVRKSMLDSGS